MKKHTHTHTYKKDLAYLHVNAKKRVQPSFNAILLKQSTSYQYARVCEGGGRWLDYLRHLVSVRV